jgi:DNA mismatch endonuclease (patch repair protein)
MDTVTKQKRSWIMSRIKSRGTQPEMTLRKAFRDVGLRYRCSGQAIDLVKPDIFFPKAKVAVFAQGCYWHGHADCGGFKPPKTNTAFWVNKILSNKERDCADDIALRMRGWVVERVWECELKVMVKEEKLASYAQYVASRVKSRSQKSL